MNRTLSRKQIGSANRLKTRQKLARLEAKIAFVRQDGLHKLTSRLVSL
ncbi:MAG: transposase [Alphaproteobacteria bacterium]